MLNALWKYEHSSSGLSFSQHILHIYISHELIRRTAHKLVSPSPSLSTSISTYLHFCARIETRHGVNMTWLKQAIPKPTAELPALQPTLLLCSVQYSVHYSMLYGVRYHVLYSVLCWALYDVVLYSASQSVLWVWAKYVGYSLWTLRISVSDRPRSNCHTQYETWIAAAGCCFKKSDEL